MSSLFSKEKALDIKKQNEQKQKERLSQLLFIETEIHESLSSPRKQFKIPRGQGLVKGETNLFIIRENMVSVERREDRWTARTFPKEM